MMRSWGARPDTVVCDEPLYAHYLKQTGYDHPGAAEIIAQSETGLSVLVDRLTRDPEPRRAIFYQKHMAHHLLAGMDTSWVEKLTNAFLIREPGEMLTSLMSVLPNPDLAATGLPLQLRLVEREADRMGVIPPVLDARETLEDPEGMLRALCERLGVEFMKEMLSWPAGPRETDGVWAKHWYASVERSTGFSPYVPKLEHVPARHTGLLRECEVLYRQLHDMRIVLAPKES